MTDEEAEQAFLEAKAAAQSPETAIEQEADEIEEQDTDLDKEIEVDDLEQPSADSNDDTSDDEETEEEIEDDSEEEDNTPDGDEDTTDEQPEAIEDKVEAEAQPVKKHTIKAVGQEFEFTEAEMIEKFGAAFSQAMDYTKKTQALRPHLTKLDIIKKAELSEEQLNFAVDLLKGDKGAINDLLKRTGVDALTLDEEENTAYTPNSYGRSEAELNLREVEERLKADPEYDKTFSIVSNRFDSKSMAEFTSNPSYLEAMHEDVKNGVYDKVNQIAQKMKVFSPDVNKSDLDYYKLAANEYEAQRQAGVQASQQQATIEAQKQQAEAEAARIAKVKADTAKREANKAVTNKRKAASPTKGGATTHSQTIDYLNASDEEFEKWERELEARM